jgi:pimeloyl-ACP methyl ester carboxylesterase
VVGAVALGALLLATSAQAIQYAPVNAPGPPLSVPQVDLDAALECTGDLAGATRAPVMMVHGTCSNPQHNFSWNWEPALNKLGIPWCTVALLDNGLADIQTSGEYVVNAIRTMHAQAGREISLIGHSQGGMVPRWALRFWPDTREMVDDLIGLAPSNHGSSGGDFVCTAGCSPAFWQQSASSEFVKALNSFQETFAGTSYTVVYTHTDWVVTPNFDDTGSSSLHGGGGEISNTAIQDICPLDLNEHNALGTVDAVAYALAIDALDHPGPADPARIPGSVCTQPFMPGVNPATVATDAAATAADLLTNIATYPPVPAEPPLRCYVTASCPAQGGSGSSSAGSTQTAIQAGPAKKHKKHKKHKKKRRKNKRRG